MDQVGWQRACSKCLSDNIEKVGDRYWYCSDCGNIIEVVASAGKPVLPTRNVETFAKPPGDKPLKPEPPSPGTLQATDRLDFPLP